MICKFTWFLFVFLVLVGFLFLASFGIAIQDCIYEKTEIILGDKVDK